jgi:hypothetical protein
MEGRSGFRSPRAQGFDFVDEAGSKHGVKAQGDAFMQPGAVLRLQGDQDRRRSVALAGGGFFGRALRMEKRQGPARHAKDFESARDAL